MTTANSAALEAVAAGQRHLVNRAQVLAAGHTDMFVYRRIRSGRWQRVLAGVYCLTTGTLTVEQRRVAAALYAGDEAQLTGRSALSWYGFRAVAPDDRVQMLVPHATRCRSNGFVTVRRTLWLDPAARPTGLYRVCSPSRAVVDTCRELTDLRTVRAVMAEAVQRYRVPLRSLDLEVRRAARSNTALARLVLDEILGGARSAPEAQTRAVLEQSRLLKGRVWWNPRLTTADGVALPTPDGYLSDAGLAIEVDSREFHLSPQDWARTLERHNTLARHGVQVLHFTPAFVAAPRGSTLPVEKAGACRTSSTRQSVAQHLRQSVGQHPRQSVRKVPFLYADRLKGAPPSLLSADGAVGAGRAGAAGPGSGRPATGRAGACPTAGRSYDPKSGLDVSQCTV